MKRLHALIPLLSALFCMMSPVNEAQSNQYPKYFYYITETQSGELFACTDQTGLYRSIDSGSSFEYIGLPDMYLHHVEEGPDGALYVCAVDAGIFRSRDLGETWTVVNTGLGDDWTTLDFLFISDAIIAGTNDGVFVSDNGGDTWRQTGLDGIEARGLLQLSSGDILCAGRIDGLFISTDVGETWEPLESDIPESVDTHKLCEYDDGTLILASWGNGVWRSSDHGATWTQVLAITDDPRVDFAIVDNGSLYVTSHNEGVYVSDDGGDSWTRTFEQLPWRVKYLEFASSGALFAVTWGNGIWRSDNDGATWTEVPAEDNMTLVNDIRPSPMTLTAGPNPFNAALTVTCILQSPENVGLVVYNILGQPVATLVSGHLNAGQHTFVWDAGAFSTGTYFIVLKGDSKILNEKVMLLK